MTNLDLALIATDATASLLLCLFFTKRVRWNWTKYANSSEKTSAPFWLGLISLLSLGAIVFSIHALLVTHGAAR